VVNLADHFPFTFDFQQIEKSVKQKPEIPLVSIRTLAAVPTISTLTITPWA